MVGMKSAAVVAILALWIPAGSAFAQSEGILRDAFEGRRVVILTDMPADEDGINVEVDKGRSIDRSEVYNDLKKYGVAIHQGEAAEITLIKKKGKHIEFQLNGGGWDGVRTAGLNYTPAPKSERHKAIEAELALLPDPAKKNIPAEEKKLRLRKILEEDLHELTLQYQAVNAKHLSDARERQARAQENLDRRILTGGARFNLRFDRDVPPDALTPKGLMDILEKYVDFSPQAVEAADRNQGKGTAERETQVVGRESGREVPEPASAEVILRYLRKGLLWEDALNLLGSPSSDEAYKEGTLDMRRCVFEGTSLGIIEADFVENMLLRYTISSR